MTTDAVLLEYGSYAHGIERVGRCLRVRLQAEKFADGVGEGGPEQHRQPNAERCYHSYTDDVGCHRQAQSIASNVLLFYRHSNRAECQVRISATTRAGVTPVNF